MKPRGYWRKAALATLAFAFGQPPSVYAQTFEPCGSLYTGFGPFDYRTTTDYYRQLVEGAHFTLEIETLQKQRSNAYFGADIDYTLQAFPNHPRALLAMMKLAARQKTERPQGAKYALACYFDRAIRFAPDDPGVRIVYGHYLIEKRDAAAARRQLELAREKSRDSPNLSYNLGLAYFDLKDYELARECAARAYELGFPLQGLKKKLMQVGKWQD